MGYRVKVIIPRDFLMVQLNVADESYIEQYEECIAFALSDRWQIDDLEFEIRDDVFDHSFICESDDPGSGIPTDIEFSVALEQAIKRYKLSIGGDRIWGMFTPPMDRWMSGPPEENSEEESS